MKTRKNNSLLFAVNTILALAGISILYFASLFWMGSKEEYDDLVKNSYWTFFANRLLFNVLIGLLIIGVIGGINLLVQKMTKARARKQVWKILAFDFLIFTIFSIVFIAFQLS